MSDHEPESEGTYIPRPTNCWLVFRTKWYAEYIEQGGKQLPMSEVSKLAATAWDLIKAANGDAEYRAEAANNSSQHQLNYPGYKYQPGKAKQAKKAAKRKANAKLNEQVEAYGKLVVAGMGSRATSSKDVVGQEALTHPDQHASINPQTQPRLAVFRRAPEKAMAGGSYFYSHATNQEAMSWQNTPHQQSQYSLPPDEFTMVDPYNPDRFALHGDAPWDMAGPVNQYSDPALWCSQQLTSDVVTSSAETVYNGHETSQARYYFGDPDPQSALATSRAGIYFDSNGASGFSEAGSSSSHVQNASPLLKGVTHQQFSALDEPHYYPERFQHFELPYEGTEESAYQEQVDAGSQFGPSFDYMLPDSPSESSSSQPSFDFNAFNQHNADQSNFP